MKRTILLLMLCLCAGLQSNIAQVSVSEDGNPADSSAMLDVRATDKGVLIPRLSLEQIAGIISPAEGLLVYCTDFKLVVQWNGTEWTRMDGSPMIKPGSVYQGGIVFAVPPPGLDAYVLDVDYPAILQWGCQESLIGGLTSAMGSGELNTALIVAGCPDTNIAAYYCHSLTKEGYSDWYLPSGTELMTAYQSLPSYWTNEHNFWTSLEDEANPSWAFKYNKVYYGTFSLKSILNHVRCIRKTDNTCFPQPSDAVAGPDQLLVMGTSVTLQANAPTSGTGQWSLTSGTGGNIADPFDPGSSFTGLPGNSYSLLWTVSNTCGSRMDAVHISFMCTPYPSVANAGPDQVNLSQTTTILQGNSPVVGTGQWSIISGQYGFIEAPSDPFSVFYGQEGEEYILRWTITSACGSNYDEALVSFQCNSIPTQANAGPDVLLIPTMNNFCTIVLQGNSPIVGTGHWEKYDGPGLIHQPTNPNSLFTGNIFHPTTLLWVIETICAESTDTVLYSFQCSPLPPQANAGIDQLNIPGTSTLLQGSTPACGGCSGYWYILNGTGGSITSPTLPDSYFSGLGGINYTLQWVISANCGFTSDSVTIGFACPAVNAGSDQINLDGTTAVMNATTPATGSYQWTILEGAGGSFADPFDPYTTFTGLPGTLYTLRWTLNCSNGPSSDEVNISFQCATQPTQSDAGPDQLNINGLSTSLQGNTPVTGTGQWSIVSGTGGNITDPSSPSSAFSGIEGNSYTLRWSITACSVSTDDVVISFACPTANAGADQLNLPGTSTTLQGNVPTAGTGQWTIIYGPGGSVANPSDPSSSFSGNPGVIYNLRWSITSNCTTVHDEVYISFECLPPPTQANAGPDQTSIAGVTTTLQGNTPVYGTGQWTILSGANGIITEAANPASTFTGTNGTTYVLSWTITNTCGSSSDYVTISFATFTCGNTFQDTRDGQVYTTVQEGTQCWMKQNLNYSTGNSYCYSGNPANCDNYGRLYDWTTASTACPTGWHLPTDPEWCTLLSGIDGTVSCAATGVTGTDAGGKMKETGTTYWQTPNAGATNSSGFSARGGGSTTIAGRNLTQWGSFWSATTVGSNRWSWEMTYNDARVWHMQYAPSNTMSVRCMKN